MFDLAKGTIVCEKCASNMKGYIYLSKGTIKQLKWFRSNDLQMAERIKCSPSAISEGLHFLEAFVPFHLGKEPKSLGVLRKIR